MTFVAPNSLPQIAPIMSVRLNTARANSRIMPRSSYKPRGAAGTSVLGLCSSGASAALGASAVLGTVAASASMVSVAGGAQSRAKNPVVRGVEA